jgi:glutamyl/glutaminyl-tRNA synthetase
MSSTRVSNRLRAKRFKAGTATAEDKAYVDNKYNNLVFEDWFDAEKSVKPLSRAENKALQKKSNHIIFDSDDDDDDYDEKFNIFSRTENNALEEDLRCDQIILNAINNTEIKKPTLIITVAEKYLEDRKNVLIALQSLIEERENKINSLYRLNDEIEGLEKKLAQPKVINNITPEKFINILSDMGYIKK